MKPRVFVSSVIKGFEEMREAARRGIEKAGCEPVLVNEDFPALPDSPRNASLDGVDSSDIYLVLVGSRGGSRAPSGKTVVEEEFARARLKKLPVLVFLQNIQRDSDAERLATQLSDLIEGQFRKSFETAEELTKLVAHAVQSRARGMEAAVVDPESIVAELTRSNIPESQASLRFVLAPERDEEVIDLVALESSDLTHRVYRIAHDPKVGLYSYSAPKEQGRTREGVSFAQSTPGFRKEAPDTHVEIRPNGRLLIDIELTNSPVQSDSFWSGLVVTEQRVTEALRACFAFSAEFFDSYDRQVRHARLLYAISMVNPRGRQLVPQTPGNQLSGASFPRRGTSLIAERPRIVSRDDLRNPDGEIERILVLMRRRFAGDDAEHL